MRLKGKKAFVTGASRGIGREIVRRFLEEGASVWAFSTKESPFKAELDEIALKSGAALSWYYGDVSEESVVVAKVGEALKASGGFDILVNNAGITRDGLVFRMSREDWDAVMDVNMTGSFLVARECARDMIKKRAGSIINVSSVVGLRGNAGQCNYSASKAALIGFTKSLAQETGGRGVRVNAIAPGFIETDMTDKLSDDLKKAYAEKIPLRRLGAAKEVADAAVFLASDESNYITGQVLGVDGGMGM